MRRQTRGTTRTPPWVNVTLHGPDDGGDFGPNTQGTRTGGIQEALDYAHENFRDVYIWGGRGGVNGRLGVEETVYHLQETLKIPWSQDFRLDGGNSLLRYEKNTGNAVHIDSQMSCKYRFGLITSSSAEATVAIRPETEGPDNFCTVVTSDFEFAAPVNFQSIGLLLDSSKGGIAHNRVFSTEINSNGTGLRITDSNGTGKSINNNEIRIMMMNQYHATGDAIGIRLGDPGSTQILYNKIETALCAPRGAYFDEKSYTYKLPETFAPPENSVGADIFAQNNVLSLVFYGKRSPGNDILFEEGSRDNTIHALNLPNGYTNRATVPTNRIVPSWDVDSEDLTPQIPASGEVSVNRTPFTVRVMITSAGKVSRWTIIQAVGVADGLEKGRRTRASQAQGFGGLVAGQTLTLMPGDGVRFDYARPPVWKWKALR